MARRAAGDRIFGASLFYGDAVLTPAISVLSAVEGLEVGTSASSRSRADRVVVLVALFAFEASGTRRGQAVRPVMLTWFIASP